MQTSQIKFELSLLKLQNETSAKSLRKCSHINCPSSWVADELSILTQLILQKKIAEVIAHKHTNRSTNRERIKVREMKKQEMST